MFANWTILAHNYYFLLTIIILATCGIQIFFVKK